MENAPRENNEKKPRKGLFLIVDAFLYFVGD